jgi:glucokinase
LAPIFRASLDGAALDFVYVAMSDFHFPFPVLVCDIGGTNVRFAMQSEPGGKLGEVEHLRTWDYPGLVEATEAAVAKLGVKPRSLIACGAGPVTEKSLKLTNAPWHIDGADVAKRLKLDAGLLLNDFEAQALSLPTIPSDWARQIGPVEFGAPGPKVILGPGTGLGIGALIEAAGRHTPLSSEACHIDFGPVTPEDWAIWPHLERAHGRITTESVLSGAGLVRVHKARIAATGAPTPEIDAPALTAAALANLKGPEAESVRLYWNIVARFAGDMAIAFVAFGGVTLAGGVLPRLVDLLDEAAFRAAFEDKAPVDALARKIPTRLVTQSDSVLVGMAAIASKPGGYAIDFAARDWK